MRQYRCHLSTRALGGTQRTQLACTCSSWALPSAKPMSIRRYVSTYMRLKIHASQHTCVSSIMHAHKAVSCACPCLPRVLASPFLLSLSLMPSRRMTRALTHAHAHTTHTGQGKEAPRGCAMLPQTVADIQRLGDNPYVNFPEVLTHIDLLPAHTHVTHGEHRHYCACHAAQGCT